MIPRPSSLGPALIGSALLLTLAATPSAGQVLVNNGQSMALGILTQGEVDSTEEGALITSCLHVLRPALVTVWFTPLSSTDAVRVRVAFASGAQEFTLTAASPLRQVGGMAPDTCLTPTTLTGASVASAVAYEVSDAQANQGT